MLIISLFTALLLAQNEGRVVTTAPLEGAQPAQDVFGVEADPPTITRGRTTTVVVKGADVEALKTLGVSPPDGVRLGEIKVLPPAKDGREAISVAVTVDASAEPGERALTLTVAPTVAGSGARPGDDEAAKQMEQMIKEIIKRGTKAEPAGALHINSHDIKITKVELIGRGTDAAIRITVEDEKGDLEPGAPSAAEAGKEGALVQIVEPVVSEVRCGDEVFYAVLGETTIHERKLPSVVLQADLDSSELGGKSGCELRVQVVDKAGNISAWSATKL